MFLFIGEKRSRTAIERGWTWESGRLAARTLDDALTALGIGVFEYSCLNILTDEGRLNVDTLEAIAYSLHRSKCPWHIIALGHIAAALLRRHGIPHVMMIHPAARGSIRKKGRYQAHVRETLAPFLALPPAKEGLHE